MRDIILGILQKFWEKPYIQDAAHLFLHNIAQDLIQDIEITPDKQKNQYLIQMLQAVQDENLVFGLETVGRIVIKS